MGCSAVRSQTHPYCLRAVSSIALLLLLLCTAALVWPAGVRAQSAQNTHLVEERGSSALAQYVPTTLTSRNGLPENSVRAIAQSTDGYLWLGTEEGLVRYDGSHTRVFDRSTDSKLHDNFVTSISAVGDGSIWFSTRSGVYHLSHGSVVSYLPVDGRALRFVFCDAAGTIWVGTNHGLFNSSALGNSLEPFAATGAQTTIYQMTEAADGTLWLAASNGLWHIAHGHALRYGTADGLPEADVRTVTAARDGSIWLATPKELLHWHNAVLQRVAVNELALHGRVSALLVDPSGRLWIGMDRDGIVILQGNRVQHYRSSDGLPSDSVKVLHRDRDDNLWIGLNSAGSVRFHAGLFTTYGTREGLSDNTLFLARTARDGSVWTATLHQQLNHLLPNGTVVVIGAKQGLPPGILYSMFEDTDGSLWAGSDMGDLIHVVGMRVTVFHNPAHAQDQLRDIVRGPDGDLFLLYHSELGLVRFRNGRFLTEPRNIPGLPAAAARDTDGSLWIGSDRGGVTHWNNSVLAVFGPRQGIKTELIESMAVDADGTVWIGSPTDGLLRLNKGNVTTFVPQNGLFDYTVGTITDDQHGWLWMTSNKGLYKVRKQELTDMAEGRIHRIHSIAYGVPDGMRTAECNYDTSPSASLAPDGWLWFASSEGLVSVMPSASTSRASFPNAVVEGVTVDRVATEGAETMQTQPGNHDVEFDFTAADFAAPERLQFRYKLQGFDTDWIDAGKRHQAFYTRLPAGDYTFQVQATDGNSWPQTAATMQLTVPPHFWQRTWFVLFCVCLFLLCGWGGYEIRVMALHRNQRILQEQVIKRTAELQQAMREAEHAQHELRELATRDSLTRLWNRRHIFNMLSNEASRAEREQLSLCVLMLDVDHFKQVNDICGHLAGDRVLQAVSNVLIEQTRPYDCAGRYGGEEFLVILCNCTLENGVRRADAIREAIAQASVDWCGKPLNVTASFGVALHIPGRTIEAVLDEADRALYRAKHTGRNRVCALSLETDAAPAPTLAPASHRANELLDRSHERRAMLRPALTPAMGQG